MSTANLNALAEAKHLSRIYTTVKSIRNWCIWILLRITKVLSPSWMKLGEPHGTVYCHEQKSLRKAMINFWIKQRGLFLVPSHSQTKTEKIYLEIPDVSCFHKRTMATLKTKVTWLFRVSQPSLPPSLPPSLRQMRAHYPTKQHYDTLFTHQWRLEEGSAASLNCSKL